MEHLNSIESNSIFEVIIHICIIGLMIDGKLVWLQGEVRNEDISIALIIREHLFYLRALQGHSGGNLIDLTLQDDVLIGPGICPYIPCGKQFQSLFNYQQWTDIWRSEFEQETICVLLTS